MPIKLLPTAALCLLTSLLLTWIQPACAGDLQQAAPTLNGAGISIIQAEATLTSGTNDTFEVNPSVAGLPPSIFTYINSGGSIATTFPNTVGMESSHADEVAANLAAVAPGISTLDNYDASYYYDNVVSAGLLPTSINPVLHNAQIVNQSFVFTGYTQSDLLAIDQAYDSYAATNNVLFISAAGNSVSPAVPPSTAYNSIGVNALSLSPATSATLGGRSVPELTAPGDATSFSTPYVTGVAALLLQAADAGAGGAGTETAASDIRTMKALLLNGATKPAGWSDTSTQPLDPVYGSGIVDAYQSWLELTAGKHTALSSSGANSALTPSGNLVLTAGWDLGSLPGGNTTNHYFFTAPQLGIPADTLTATIDWNVTDWDANNNPIFNNLDLALYNVTTNTPERIGISDSTVDNLQQLYLTDLAPGDIYDLRVYQASSPESGGTTYGLAYSVVPEPSTLALLAAGVLGLVAWRRRRGIKHG
jgi:Subtilase family/PEP-CTERM motif